MCLFLLPSTCPGFSSFNRFVNRFPLPHSLPLAQTGFVWWSLATQSLNPPRPISCVPQDCPVHALDESPCQGLNARTHRGGPSWRPRDPEPASHCLLSFSGEMMLALKHGERWEGVQKEEPWVGGPGRHLGGIRLHRPQVAGDKCPSYMSCALPGAGR